MKQALLLLLCLLMLSCARTPALQPMGTDFYYARNPTRAYHLLKDTAAVSPVIPVLELEPEDNVLALGMLNKQWFQFSHQGVRYYGRFRDFALSKPERVRVESPKDNSGYNTGRQLQTGPRGGHYYINSNGNKSYVPRK